jgi:hypothetical protein
MTSKLTAGFIALALCVCWFFFIREIAYGNAYNTFTPVIFAADSRIGHFDAMSPNYLASRAGAWWLSGRFMDAADGRAWIKTVGDFKNVIAFYNAAWLGMTFLLLIFFVDNALFLLPLVFAGMCYTLIPFDYCTIYPWDMPAMFFFTLSCLLWLKGKYFWMLPVIVLGTWFKETIAVTALLWFFTPMGRVRQCGLFATAACACLLLKLWVTHRVTGHAQIFTEDFSRQHGAGIFGTFLVNLQSLRPHWNHPVFANAGTLAVALCLPAKDRIGRGIKTVLAVFCVGQLFGGYIRETREFLEALPITAIFLERTISRSGAEGVGFVWLKKGYWLAAGLAMAIVIGLSSSGALPPEDNSSGQLDLTKLRPVPDSVENLNNLALMLATSPDAKERNGALAVELAERACERTQYRHPIVLSTLATAYAEAGRFDDAIAAAQKACALAERMGIPELVKKNQENLALFRDHLPFHQPGGPNDQANLPR